MRKLTGILCIVLGVVCLVSSGGFVVFNRMEAASAEASSQALLQAAQEIIVQAPVNTPQPEPVQETVDPSVLEESGEMPSVKLGKYDCIGILSIPVLELELPVLDDWDYTKLKKAPCRYYGSCYEGDFVIAAHNNPAHFGKLSQLRPEDLILFADTDGSVHYYKVALTETLQPTATEQMITSGFDLSLYTCTPGGNNRVTVRCRKI